MRLLTLMLAVWALAGPLQAHASSKMGGQDAGQRARGDGAAQDKEGAAKVSRERAGPARVNPYKNRKGTKKRSGEAARSGGHR
jgi:hypothetical protein